ncbi:16768_t:CDS:1 [Dentiscutata erythropus]|uniref:16768_t:CDS:1 n=1 Tax=Dentiscutata erythropus TaxID=1348616 RepID=A0A9N9HIJ6_9GLOM|nr:16768_t:CDS:1 [Dentiscutata erythropus]
MEDTKFILSIDGGGFRGLIPSIILSEIEKRVTNEIKKDHPNADIRCADLFDIISGTSTGSIIALGLSIPDAAENDRPKLDAQYIVDFYKDHGYDVFPDYSPIMFVDKLLSKTDKLLTAYAEKETVEIKESIENLTEKEFKKGGLFKRFFSISRKKTSVTESKVDGITVNKVDIVTMNKVDVATMNEVDVTTMNKVDVTTMNKVDVTTMNKVNITPNIKDSTMSEADKEKEKEYFTEAIMYLKGFENAYNPWKPKYLPNKFEKLLQETFEQTKLKDTVNNVTVIVPSYNITNGEYTFFTSNNPEHENLFMKDVIRASAAAPSYFPAGKIGSNYFVDGGVFSNNPTVMAYLEAKRMFPNSKFVVVSLGTGYYKEPLEAYKDSGVIQWIRPLIDLLFNSELDNNDNTMKLLAKIDSTTYHRIQLKLSKDNSSLDNVSEKEVSKLTKLANDIINDLNDTYKFKDIINLLVDKYRKKNIKTAK